MEDLVLLQRSMSWRLGEEEIVAGLGSTSSHRSSRYPVVVLVSVCYYDFFKIKNSVFIESVSLLFAKIAPRFFQETLEEPYQTG